MREMNWFVDKHVELIGGEIIEEGRMTPQHWVGVIWLVTCCQSISAKLIVSVCGARWTWGQIPNHARMWLSVLGNLVI